MKPSSMSRVGILLVLFLILAGCSAELPEGAIEATARAVVAEEIGPVTFFRDGDDLPQVFFQDADATEQILEVGEAGGYLRSGALTIWILVPNDKLSDDVGILRIVPPQAVQDRASFGGISDRIRGIAEVTSPGLNLSFQSVAKWTLLADGRLAIEVLYMPGARNSRLLVEGKSGVDDWPFNFHNGLRVFVTMPHIP